MNFQTAIEWMLANKELLLLCAAIVSAIGAAYRPTRDLLMSLPHFIWTAIIFIFLIIRFVTWPIRKMIALLYMKFVAQHVESLFDRIFEWFEKKEAAKEAARQQPIE